MSQDKTGNYKNLLENSYRIQCELDDEMSRSAFLADYIFCFTTYDSDIGEMFARKALEVCAAISNQTIIRYTENEDDYRWYLLMINMSFFAGRLNWGTSIRGAWWNHEGQTLEACGLWEGDEQALSLNFTRHEWKDFIAAMVEFSTDTQKISRTA
ncbi:hypothetical protein UNDKW_1623 [Undibacterium sp. KW1]|uniref:hypothetical protein n=1 Tax=Undibacterium sp. KW1 TaxID=2058624 RepID=UPI001331D353|nr:hypothetical protein [Undibacterium sp. KW1]BBB59896.1 hypothetical protein UNDKW_1623 [Undibacterium sp. KW1]